MKKLLGTLLCLGIISFGSICNAADEVWYRNDTPNREPILITDTTFMGMPIIKRIKVDYTDYIYVVNDNGNVREFSLRNTNLKNNSGRIIIDNNTNEVATYCHAEKPNTQHQKDSIGGLYIGMTRSEAVIRYGEGISDKDDTIHSEDLGEYTFKWKKHRETIYYPELKMRLGFYLGELSSIFLEKGSDRRFDDTGLGPDDSLEAFEEVYEHIGKKNSHSFWSRSGLAICKNEDGILFSTYEDISICAKKL